MPTSLIHGTATSTGAEEHNQDGDTEDLPYRFCGFYTGHEFVEYVVPEIFTEKEE